MKKGKGILIAVLCVLIASMVGVMIWMITLGGTGAREFWKNFGFSFSSGDAKLVNEQELDVTGYSEISITYRSADLIFETSETGSFTVSEYMAGKPEEENLAKIQNDTKNGTLSVEEGKSFYAIGFLNFGTGIRYVKIGIPAKFRGSLNIKTGSGNVTMSDTKAGDLSVTVGSGDVTLLRIGGKTVTCRSGSGNLNLNQIEGDLDVLTGSGDVNITGIKGNVISETGSGEQQIADSTGDVKSQAGSGDLFLDRIGGGIDARTGSGDIRITGLEEKSFTLQATTHSGDIGGKMDSGLSYNKKGTEATGSFGEKPEYLVSLDTGSGDITLN